VKALERKSPREQRTLVISNTVTKETALCQAKGLEAGLALPVNSRKAGGPERVTMRGAEEKALKGETPWALPA
jgi:hypothetical protein